MLDVHQFHAQILLCMAGRCGASCVEFVLTGCVGSSFECCGGFNAPCVDYSASDFAVVLGCW